MSGFNLDLGPCLSQSDKWLPIYAREKAKNQCQNKAISKRSRFSKKEFWRCITVFATLFKWLKVLSYKCSKKLQYDVRTLSMKTYFILILLQNNKNDVFEAANYFAFSLP